MWAYFLGWEGADVPSWDGQFDHRRLEPLPTSVLVGGSMVGSALRLFLCQVVMIIILCQIIGLVMQKLHQPRVIAEVIAGILLGPTAFGAIPGFTNTFFPPSSIPSLKNTAEIGLMLFLVVIGMELDTSFLNGSRGVAKLGCLSFTGQGFCWIISLPVSYALYQTLMIDFDTNLINVMLFIGVAMSVTALPVLSRILSEDRLLDTKVGAAAISAAVFDDLSAWCLLALTISLTGNGTPIEALYVFIATGVLAAFMFTVVKRWLRWALYKLNGMNLEVADEIIQKRLESSPRSASSEEIECPEMVTATSVTLVLVLALGAGYITEVIGVSPIFGAFLTGLIVPRDAHGFFTVALTEKIEDVTCAVLLPLYFAVSGLATNFLKLNTWRMWGLALMVFLGACIGKIFGGAFFITMKGFTRRECVAIGFLMNARGLVELIVLNAGLNAGVINGETFTIMVLMAVSTTFMTSPLVRWVYPPKYRTPHVDAMDLINAASPTKRPALSSIAGMLEKSVEETDAVSDVICQSIRLLVLLPDKESAVYGLCRVFRMLLTKTASFLAVRLYDVGDMDHDRVSSTMKLQANQDTVMTALKRFHGEMEAKHHVLLVGGREEDSTPQAIVGDIYKLAQAKSSNLVLVPWRGASTPGVLEYLMLEPGSDTSPDAPNAACTVACLVDRGVLINRRPHLVVPFRGGADDRDALLLAMVMCKNGGVQLTVIVSSDIDGVFYSSDKLTAAAAGGGEGALNQSGGGVGSAADLLTGGGGSAPFGPGHGRSFSASQNQPWAAPANNLSPLSSATSSPVSPDVLLLKAVEGLGAHVTLAADVLAANAAPRTGGRTSAPGKSPSGGAEEKKRLSPAPTASVVAASKGGGDGRQEAMPSPAPGDEGEYRSSGARRIMGSGPENELLQAMLDVVAISEDSTYVMVICGRHGNPTSNNNNSRNGALAGPLAGATVVEVQTNVSQPLLRGRPESTGSVNARGSSRSKTEEVMEAAGNLRRNQSTVDSRASNHSPTRFRSDNHDPLNMSSHHRRRAMMDQENRVIGPLGAQLMQMLPSAPIMVVRASATTASAVAERRNSKTVKESGTNNNRAYVGSGAPGSAMESGVPAPTLEAVV